MKLDQYTVASARRDYYTLVAGVRAAAPEALKDPLVAACVAQIEVAELALSARLDQLIDDSEDDSEGVV